MTVKTKNTQSLTVFNQVVTQDIKKSFEEAHLDAKMYWISTATLWNSTTVTTLLLTLASLANHSQEPSDLAVTQSEQWMNLAQLEHWLGLNLGLEYWQSELFLDLSTQFWLSLHQAHLASEVHDKQLDFEVQDIPPFSWGIK